MKKCFGYFVKILWNCDDDQVAIVNCVRNRYQSSSTSFDEFPKKIEKKIFGNNFNINCQLNNRVELKT